MIRIITRVCMATAAVLLLAVPMEANYLRRVQMVATEGRLLSLGWRSMTRSSCSVVPSRAESGANKRSIGVSQPHTLTSHPALTHTYKSQRPWKATKLPFPTAGRTVVLRAPARR